MGNRATLLHVVSHRPATLVLWGEMKGWGRGGGTSGCEGSTYGISCLNGSMLIGEGSNIYNPPGGFRQGM